MFCPGIWRVPIKTELFKTPGLSRISIRNEMNSIHLKRGLQGPSDRFISIDGGEWRRLGGLASLDGPAGGWG